MTARRVLVGVVLALLAAALFGVVRGLVPLWIIAVQLSVVLLLLLFERGRYRPRVAPSNDWFVRTNVSSTPRPANG